MNRHAPRRSHRPAPPAPAPARASVLGHCDGPTLRTARALGLTLVCATLLACGARRTITVTSEPTGALVHLNDTEVGRTPVTVPFKFYGTYDVQLEKRGYETLWTRAQAQAPFYEYPGPDLVAEAVGTRTEIAWHFELQPLDLNDPALPDHVVRRAVEMREATERGSLPAE